MKILLTGTGGYIGGALLQHWQKKHDVFSIPSRKEFEQAKIPHKLECIVHAGFSTDFSLATEEKLKNSHNIRNSRFLMEQALSLDCPFIFIGAAGTFGLSRDAKPLNESNFAGSDSPYMKTTYIQEKIIVERMLEHSALRYTSLCPSTVYGPNMSPFVQRSLYSKYHLVPPGGTSGIAISDFLNACDLTLTKKPQGRLLLNGFNCTYRDLFSTIDSIKKQKSLKIPLPNFAEPAAKIAAQLLAQGAILHSAFSYKYYSAQRASDLLSWKPLNHLRDILEIS